MSPIKFKTVLRLEKLSKTTNEAPVCLRITKDRKSTYKTLLHVSPSCWDAKGQCVIRHPNADLFNAVISSKRAEIEREACLLTLSGNEVSIVAIRNKINDHMAMDFLEYAYRHCRSLMAEKYGTYLRLRSVLNKLRGFVGAGGSGVSSRLAGSDPLFYLSLHLVGSLWRCLPPFARFNRLFINALQRHSCASLRTHTGIMR